MIAVVTKDGVTVKVERWANDTHPDFDPIYEYLLALYRGVTAPQLVYEGPFAATWRPPGAPRLS